MTLLDEQFVVDKEGRRLGVILSEQEYRQLLDAAEELDAIRAYDAAKADPGEMIPFDQAVREIESGNA